MQIQGIDNYSQNKHTNFRAVKNVYLEGLLGLKRNSRHAKRIENAIKQIPVLISFSKKQDIDIFIKAQNDMKFAEDDIYVPSISEICYSAKVTYQKQSKNKKIQALMNFLNIKDTARCVDYTVRAEEITDKDVNDFINYITSNHLCSLKTSLEVKERKLS